MERGEMGGGCGQSDKERQDYECHPFCPSLSEQPAATTRTLRRFPPFSPLERIPELILHLTPMFLTGRPGQHQPGIIGIFVTFFQNRGFDNVSLGVIAQKSALMSSIQKTGTKKSKDRVAGRDNPESSSAAKAIFRNSAARLGRVLTMLAAREILKDVASSR